jgi:hypothetical protein
VDAKREAHLHAWLLACGQSEGAAAHRTGIRRWALHHRSDKSLKELAAMYDPTIRGWIVHYSQFYRTQLRPTLRRIDACVIRWARHKYKRMVHQTRGAREWFDQGSRSRAMINKKVHALRSRACLLRRHFGGRKRGIEA